MAIPTQLIVPIFSPKNIKPNTAPVAGTIDMAVDVATGPMCRAAKAIIIKPTKFGTKPWNKNWSQNAPLSVSAIPLGKKKYQIGT